MALSEIWLHREQQWVSVGKGASVAWSSLLQLWEEEFLALSDGNLELEEVELRLLEIELAIRMALCLTITAALPIPKTRLKICLVKVWGATGRGIQVLQINPFGIVFNLMTSTPSYPIALIADDEHIEVHSSYDTLASAIEPADCHRYSIVDSAGQSFGIAAKTDKRWSDKILSAIGAPTTYEFSSDAVVIDPKILSEAKAALARLK